MTGPSAVTMTEVAAQMSSTWKTSVRCEEVDMDEALDKLVSANVMTGSAAQVR